MNHGPNFVPLTGKLTQKDRTDVELSVERMAFTLRWQQAAPAKVERSQNEPAPEVRDDKKLYKLLRRGLVQPPQMSDRQERNIANFQEEVLKAYDKHKATKSNLSQEDREEPTRLRTDPDVTIKPSDKSKKRVAMRQELYLEKAETILSDTSNYEKVDLAIEEYEKSVKEVLATENAVAWRKGCLMLSNRGVRGFLNDMAYPKTTSRAYHCGP